MKKTFEDIKADAYARWYGFKWNVSRKAEATVRWCEKHPELALAAIPAVITVFKGTSNMVRSVDRKIDMKREQDYKERNVWDASVGKWHHLRRPMTAKESLEFDRRLKINKESAVEILHDMRLLD